MSLGITGGCICGDLRYELKAVPLFTHVCHCLDCQRETGTAFNITTIAVRDDIVITNGELRLEKISPRRTKHSCAKCGTTIYISSTAFPNTVTLRQGTLDDTSVATPQAHIWVCQKQTWLPLPDDVPKFEREYIQEEIWPAESLARLRGLPGSD